jgi:hypothetical protein
MWKIFLGLDLAFSVCVLGLFFWLYVGVCLCVVMRAFYVTVSELHVVKIVCFRSAYGCLVRLLWRFQGVFCLSLVADPSDVFC